MKVSNIQSPNLMQDVQQQRGLTPASNAWVNAIAESLNINNVSQKKFFDEPSIVLDISQNAIKSKYWNDDNINFPVINKNIQSYSEDLTLVSKQGYIVEEVDQWLENQHK